MTDTVIFLPRTFDSARRRTTWHELSVGWEKVSEKWDLFGDLMDKSRHKLVLCKAKTVVELDGDGLSLLNDLNWPRINS